VAIASSSDFIQWLLQQLSQIYHHSFQREHISIDGLTGDAGFRQYFRVTVPGGTTVIAVNAPPNLSNNLGFVSISNVLSHHRVNVPKVLSFDEQQGFMLLDDLGERQFYDVLGQENLVAWYKKAIDELVKISGINCSKCHVELPEYDDQFVLTELTIFVEWLVEKYLSISLTQTERQNLSDCFSVLTRNVAQQPKVFMHRDYHSRNLMVVNGDLAVIDFQDAVHGALTYDIVSLLRDCYKKLDKTVVDELLDYYFSQLQSQDTTSHLVGDIERVNLQRWFDLMGMQRHIKASGIFARLALRDNKFGYLKDIPLTLDYIVEVSAHYSELSWIGEFVEYSVKPKLVEMTR